MAEPDRGPSVDQSLLMDDGVLEAELRNALRSEGEIELFKAIQTMLQVKNELANSAAVRVMLSGMWTNVADFFDEIVTAPTLVGLAPDDNLVAKHQRMQANFTVVSDINQIFKSAEEAEVELRAVDEMDHEREDT